MYLYVIRFNMFEFVEPSTSVIINAFEIHLRLYHYLSQFQFPPSIRLSVMLARVLAENRSFQVVTGNGRRIRIVFDILMIQQPLRDIAISVQYAIYTDAHTLCKYSRDCKPRSNTGYDNTSTKHRVYRCIIAGTYTRTGGAYPRKAIDERYRPLLYICASAPCDKCIQ